MIALVLLLRKSINKLKKNDARVKLIGVEPFLFVIQLDQSNTTLVF